MKGCFTRLALVLGLALGFAMLGGCETTATNSEAAVAQKVQFACAGTSAAIKVLTAANDQHKLSAEVQSNVLKAIEVIDPVCTAETTPTLDDIKYQAFLKAQAYLLKTAAAHRGEST